MLYFPGLYNHGPLVDSDECAGLPSKQERKLLSLRRRTAGHHYPIQQNLFLQDLFFRCRWSFAHVFLPLVQGQRLIGLQVLHKARALPAPSFTSDFARWRKGESVSERVSDKPRRRSLPACDAAVSAPRKVGVSQDAFISFVFKYVWRLLTMPPHVLYRVLDNHNRIQAPLPTTPAHFYSIFMTLFYFNHYFFWI